jgi:beta-fructofuranosidase
MRACAGVVLIYDASDLDNWELLGELVSAETLPSTMQRAGAIWECPQLVRFGDRWLLVISWDDGAESTASVQEPSPTQGVACFIGEIGLEAGVPRFTALREDEFDSGPDFYAPQLVVDGDRILAWGWAWEGRGSGVNAPPSFSEDAVSWAGTLSFPREVIENDDGAVVCVPARELSQLRGESLRPELVNSRWQIETSVNAFSVTGEVGVRIDVVGEQSGEVRHVCASSDAGPVTVLVDGSIVEVFDRNGSLTMRAYRHPDERWRATSTAQLSGFELRLPE